VTAIPEPTFETPARHAAAWAAVDPDPVTRGQVLGLLDAGDHDTLARLFGEPLRFGTAGMRGRLGPGPGRMNSLLVRRLAAAVADALTGRVTGRPARVVLGFDAREGSAVFVEDAAGVLAAAGCDVSVLPGPNPTPLLAFAVRYLDADAGLQITASHNPREDNGVKVYLGGDGLGAQIVPPFDALVSGLLDALPLEPVPFSPMWHRLGREVGDAYQARVLSRVPSGARSLRIVFTPVHGVGGRPLQELLSAAGFTDLHPVRSQFEPDPRFPTAPRPNPEEPGVLDEAFRLADEVGADIVLALDPDADRAAVGLHDGEGFRRLSGDDTALLLAEFMLSRGLLADGVLASSLVSSTAFPRLAAHHGRRHVFTDTGFKWISRVPDLVFGYEEALGYAIDPGAVRDKDGISACVMLAHAAAVLLAEESSLLDLLDEVRRRDGLTLNLQRTVPLATADPALFERILGSAPASLGGLPVVTVEDLRVGTPSTAAVTLHLRASTGVHGRVMLRPSGTEPKLKVYLEMSAPDSTDIRSSGPEPALRSVTDPVLADAVAFVAGLLAPE
jgi:phosphomannomutase